MLAASGAIGLGLPVVCTLHAARGARLGCMEWNSQGIPGMTQGRSPARNARGAHAMAGSGVYCPHNAACCGTLRM
jgi:hypothetical protein